MVGWLVRSTAALHRRGGPRLSGFRLVRSPVSRRFRAGIQNERRVAAFLSLAQKIVTPYSSSSCRCRRCSVSILKSQGSTLRTKFTDSQRDKQLVPFQGIVVRGNGYSERRLPARRLVLVRASKNLSYAEIICLRSRDHDAVARSTANIFMSERSNEENTDENS